MADTLPAGPFAGTDGAGVAAAGDGEAELPGRRAVAVPPELTIWPGKVRRDGPGAWGEDELCAHAAESAGDAESLNKGISADHDSNASPWCPGDGQPISAGVEGAGEVEFVEFAVMKQNLAAGPNEQGGVVEMITAALDDAGANVNAARPCGGAQAFAGFAAGNRAGEFSG